MDGCEEHAALVFLEEVFFQEDLNFLLQHHLLWKNMNYV